MRKNIITLIILLIAFNCFGQEKKFTLRGYISPSICKSSIQHRVIKDGQITLTNLTKSTGLFFGGGFELLRTLDKNWLVGGDLGFISKGYFAKRDVTYNSGTLSGTGYTKTDLNFLETTIFIEKQILPGNPKYLIMLSSGLFYGLHIPNIIGFELEAKGNDFGTSISAGVQRKRTFLKIDYKKGMIKINNNINSYFKTNILCFKFGYSIL